LSENLKSIEKISLRYDIQTFDVATSEIGFSYKIDETVNQAFAFDRKRSFFYNLKLPFTIWVRRIDLNLIYDYDSATLEEFLSVIAGQVEVEPIGPSINIVNGEIAVNKGRAGKLINRERLILKINHIFKENLPQDVDIDLENVDPSIDDVKVESFKKQAERLVGKSVNLTFEGNNLVFGEDRLVNLVSPKGGLNEQKLDLLIQEIKEIVERKPQNATLVYDGSSVKEFAPAKDGITIDQEKLHIALEDAFFRLLEDSVLTAVDIEIPITSIPPEVTTEDVNNLGIKELIGRGSSNFAHSIPSRIHNISLASSKFNSILIAPGETFSFNETLGDVSSYTGYKQAYIIKDGRTVLGDGGGVCQVSTTLFRAILNAGLPVVERRAHSYRVSYYEQDSLPGLDATVYAPTTDLKFKNDTPGHILIQTIFDAKNTSLAFELYGTSDGRVSTITKPVVTGVSAPPEDLYVDDPSLSPGEVKQIDYKAWGAKVVFDYSVERNGETIYEKTFISNYKPWQAVFLRGIEVQ